MFLVPTLEKDKEEKKETKENKAAVRYKLL